jgi:hypothetical protein
VRVFYKLPAAGEDEMTDIKEMNFDDIAPIQIPVTIGGNKYLLKEANGDIVCRHRNNVINCSKLEDGKLTAIQGLPDTEFSLVQMCLSTVTDDPATNGKPVLMSVVRSWKNKVVKELFNKIKEISEMDEDDSLKTLIKQRDELNKKIDAIKRDSAKNDLSDTTVG